MKINGATLQTIRQLAGLSQAELSRRSKVSQGHISDLEAAPEPSEIRPATAKKLTDALGVPMAALIQITDEPAVAS